MKTSRPYISAKTKLGKVLFGSVKFTVAFSREFRVYDVKQAFSFFVHDPKVEQPRASRSLVTD